VARVLAALLWRAQQFDPKGSLPYNDGMTHFDLCLPWYWEYDLDFVEMIEQACQEQRVSFLQVKPDNLLEVTTRLYRGELRFGALLDRSQGDARFEPLTRWARQHFTRRINPAELSAWSEDKATMHLELIQAGLYTPYTILLPPFIDQPIIPEIDLGPLGDTFVIKPALGGGGEGVIMNASSWKEVLQARMEFPQQKYLVQAYVNPLVLDDRTAWFRIFYAAGNCYPCWWDPITHFYATVTPAEVERYALQRLENDTLKIATLCRLDWFSTEIALTTEQYVVVDYVNDGIDTRLQSKAADGVPDTIMRGIAEQLVKLVGEGIR
jgi:hypothetical protein